VQLVRNIISFYFVMLVVGAAMSYAHTKVGEVTDTHVSNLTRTIVETTDEGTKYINLSNPSVGLYQTYPKAPLIFEAKDCTEVSVIGGAGKADSTRLNLKDLANSSLGNSITGQSPLSTPVDSSTKFGETPKSPDQFRNSPDAKLSSVAAASYDFASRASGDEFLKSAQTAQTALSNFANEDQEFVSSPYRSMNRAEFTDHINRATENLSQAIKTLDQGKSDLDEGDVARLKNQYMNAFDKAQATKELLAEDSAFQNSPKDHPLAKSPALKDLFPTSDDKAASSDAVTDRLVMFNGLPKQQQEKILNESKLKFADYHPFKMRDGITKKLAILHNGTLFGKADTDCTAMLSSLLQPESRKGNFTTLDFRAMWIYKKRGFFPNPPQYPSKKAKLIRETANAFTPVDLYEGETLIPGDILVQRLPWEPSGNMFIVKTYNAKNMTAEVIDASNGGKVKHATFSIIDPSSQKQVKMGLMGLRLKPNMNHGCKMKAAQITQR
jgi:hypothetical protein